MDENPRAYGRVNYLSSGNITRMHQVTLTILEGWFTNHIVPEVKEYCASEGLPFKVLLVLDNAPGYIVDLNNFHPNVKVVYLPPSFYSLWTKVSLPLSRYNTFEGHLL